MDKLRNIINPGKAQDDSVMYGDGQTSNSGVINDHANTTGLTGSGHNDTTSTTAVRDGVPGATQNTGSGLTSGTNSTGPHSSNVANTVDPRVDSHQNTGATPTAGPHNSTLANRADPRVDSDLDGSRTTGGSTTTGLADLTHGTTHPAASQATTAASHGSTPNKANSRVDSELNGSSTRGPFAADNRLDSSQTSIQREIPHTTTTGPHDSALLNKADPRIDSDRDGSTTVGDSGATDYNAGGHGRDAAIASGAVVADGGAAENPGRHDHTRDSTYSGDAHRRHDAELGAGAVGASGLATETERHHGKQDITGTSGLTQVPTTTNTTGPHNSSLLNKLDPRVDTSTTGTRTSNTSGLGPAEPNRDFDPNSGAIAGPHPYHTRAGAILDPHGPSHNTGFGGSSVEGTNLGGSTTSTTGSGIPGSTPNTTDAAYNANHNTDTSNTTGPRSSSLLNKIDPRVHTNTTKDHNSNVPGTSDATRDHHLGRDVGLASGVGGIGYETEKHHHPDSSTTGLDGTTRDHHYGRDAGLAAGAGGVSYDAEKHHQDNLTTGPLGSKDHHHGRDAGLVAAAGGVGYEAEKHHHPGTSTTGPHETIKDHHHGRDAGLAAGAGGIGHEAEKHHQDNLTTGPLGSKKDHHHDRDAGLVAGAGGVGYETEKHHHPGTSTTGPHETIKNHHHGRDAGLTAGAGGIGHEAEKKHHQDNSTTGPLGSSKGLHHGQDAGLAAGAGGVGHEVEKDHHHGASTTNPQNSTNDHHHGRDAGLAAGAGGLAYEADRHHHQGSSATGPHSTVVGKKMDPRVDSDLDGSRTTGTSGAAIGSARTNQSDVPTSLRSPHNYGREVLLGETAGIRQKDPSTTVTTGTAKDSSTTGPHSSSLLKKLDPRVKTSSTTNQPSHDYAGRDAALAGGAATGTYEAKKHHHGTDHGTGSNLAEIDHDKKSHASETSHSHAGRDATLVGGTAVGAHEVEKHHHGNAQDKSSDLQGHQNTSTNMEHTPTTTATPETHLTGPVHSSSLLNKLDPRVKKVTADAPVGDEFKDRNTTAFANPYSSRPVDARLGGAPTSTLNDGHQGRDATPASSASAGPGAEKYQGTSGTTSATTPGLHSSNVANKMDPRVDDNLDGSKTTGQTLEGGSHHDDRNRLHKDPPASVMRE